MRQICYEESAPYIDSLCSLAGRHSSRQSACHRARLLILIPVVSQARHWLVSQFASLVDSQLIPLVDSPVDSLIVSLVVGLVVGLAVSLVDSLLNHSTHFCSVHQSILLFILLNHSS
jgi:hypothetical protein